MEYRCIIDGNLFSIVVCLGYGQAYDKLSVHGSCWRHYINDLTREPPFVVPKYEQE